jgi:hypothetical protein
MEARDRGDGSEVSRVEAEHRCVLRSSYIASHRSQQIQYADAEVPHNVAVTHVVRSRRNLLRSAVSLDELEAVDGPDPKVGIKVSKRTAQKYMRGPRGRRDGGQSWATFVKNHAERMWACDFIL